MPEDPSQATEGTLQSRIAAALEEARSRGRRVVDSAPVALAILSGDELRYQYANPIYRALRPTGTHFIGRTFGEVFPRGAVRGAETPLRDVMRQNRSWKIRDFEADVEGRGTTWWEGEALPLPNDQGVIDSVMILVWDVTDRHLAEEALRDSEQRFHDVFENAGVSMWIEDFTAVKQAVDELLVSGVADLRTYLAQHPDFVERAIELVQIIDVNETTVKLFGATSKSELTSSLPRVFTPATTRLFAEQLIALAEGRDSLSAEASMQALDGRQIDAMFTVRFHHRDGRYDGVIVTLSDITERKIIEDSLRESEGRFRRMANSAPVKIWLADPDGGRTWFNDRFLRFTGRSLEAEVGYGWTSRIHPDDFASVMDTYRSAIERRASYEMEYRLRRNDGLFRWIVEAGQPRVSELGLFEGFVGSGLDITDRKTAEEIVRSSEERYRAVVESQTEMLSRFRADGTLLFVNGAYARMQGREPEELIGSSLWDLVPDDERAHVQAQLDQLTPEEPEVSIENRFETKDGVQWVLWTNRALRFDENGRLVEAQSTGIDITDRKAMEEELRAANRVKDELLGMVSHEFRTPLATIVGNVDVLERSNLDDDERQQSLNDLRQNSGRLRRLIENMLALASDREPPEPEPMLLHRVLPTIIEAEQRMDGTRQIELYIDPGLPPVLATVGYVEQILSNLISNARKYGHPDTPIYVAAYAGAGEVSVSVRDHGDRVDPEVVARFFDPFYRGQAGMRRADGVGLGLSVCQRLVRHLGGEITATPHEDGGVIFSFTLQIAPGGDEE